MGFANEVLGIVFVETEVVLVLGAFLSPPSAAVACLLHTTRVLNVQLPCAFGALAFFLALELAGCNTSKLPRA